MKRILLLSFLITASTLQAQIKLGVKAGVSTTDFVLGSQCFDSPYHGGVFIGGIAQFKLPLTGLYLDASLLYETRRISMENETDSHVDHETIKYLTLPINAKIGLGMGSVFGAYVATGPQFSFNLGEKKIWEQNYDINGAFLSWNIGGGIQILHKIQVGYNYNIAVSKTAEVDTHNLYTNIRHSNVKENVHQFIITYLF